MRNVLNIAHRGFTRRFPHNTIEAFQAAIEIGVDGVECDVQETGDRRFIIFHDSDLFGIDISKLSLSQIENTRLEGTFKIPTLEETLDLCRNRVKLVIELKQVRSVDSFVDLLRSRTGLDDVIIASFRQDLLLKLLHLAPEISSAIITDRPVKDPFVIIESTQSDIIIVKFPSATVELVDRVHAHNISFFVWGCVGLGEIRDTLELDIDGIISDFPDLVLEELRMRA